MDLNTTSGRQIAVSEMIFAREFNEPLVHQVVTAYMAGGRQGTKAQKTRAQVSGGGKKPWKQKGSGRARAGSIRSPVWRGGGKAFAAVPRDFQQKVNRKMYRAAMRCILSQLVRQDRLVITDTIDLAEPKTKLLLAQLQELGLTNVLIITDQVGENLYLSARNLHKVDVSDVYGANPVSLVSYDRVLITVNALQQFDEVLR